VCSRCSIHITFTITKDLLYEEWGKDDMDELISAIDLLCSLTVIQGQCQDDDTNGASFDIKSQ
jgi:hypothetical protein